MSRSRRGAAGGRGRYVWVGVAALLVLLIGVSFAMSGRARSSAESEAQLVAERYVVSGFSDVLTPELVQRDIRDREYQDLLVDVQSGIMSDAHVVRVRIWKPDGDLIFSTAQLDDVEEFMAVDSIPIRQAADGQTVSVVAEVTAAPLAGLEGSQEELFVTYVPLQLTAESAPVGVVEIDQRYSAILEEANGLWRPVQIGLGVALLGLGALFGLSRRRSRRREPARWSSRPTRQTDDARRLRDAEDCALAAERASKLAQERLAEAEGRVAELEKADVPPQTRARLEELELKLRAEEAEREQAAGEAKRLRSALSEREAELALVRDRTTSTEAEKARSVDAILRAEQQHAEAEHRAAAAGTLAGEAEGRATQARTKVTELEAALRDADRRIAEAVAEATRTATETKRDEEARLSGELRAAQLESSSMKLRLAETEEALRASEARASEGEGTLAELAKTRMDADAARTELEELRLGFQRTKLDLQAARDELDGSRTELQASSAEVNAARTELEVSRGELEVSRGERDRALGELERLRGERDEAAVDVQASRAEVQASRAEVQASRDEVHAAKTQLEVSRSERDRAVAELERVRGELDEMGAEVLRLSAERAVPEGGVKDGGAAASGDGEAVSGPRLAEMEARIAEMETRRRTDVAELQRAQESLANTQVELMEANRKVRASEDRLRELEGGGAAPSHGAPEPAYSPVSSEDEEPVWAFESSDAGHDSNSADELAGGSDEPEPEPEEPPEETLSLRERLSRAAAARHRTVQPRD